MSSPPTPWKDFDPEDLPDSPPEGFVSVHDRIDTPTHLDLDLALAGDVDRVVSNVSEVLDDGYSDARDTEEAVGVVKAQEPFQPGSTRMENTKRYLAFNLFGVIEATQVTTHHVVNVEFHDMSKRRGYHFADPYRYDLATLGQRGAVYACQPGTSHAAHVLYRPYSSWASLFDWKYEIHEGTFVVGVAAGGTPVTGSLLASADIESLGNIVVATSDGELIFLTGGGVERVCMSLPGTFVTMVAGSEWLFLVTRDGDTTTDGSQNLMGRLIKFDDFCLLQKENIPIPKHHTLKWVGITEEGAPAIYDSSGTLSVMPRFRVPLSAMWVRVLNTGRIEQGTGNDRSYWPVGIMGDTFFCLVLRGQQTHPGFPRPLLNEVSISLPFNRIDSREVRLERQIIQETLLLDILRDGMGNKNSAQDLAERELALDKTLIQLVEHACQTSNQGRALDFARLLHALPSLDAAIKLAMSFGLTHLQKAIEHLKTVRAGPVWRVSSASRPPVKLVKMEGAPNVGNSSQKRPADNDRSCSGNSDAKRRAVRESQSASGENNASLPLRGNPFLRKPTKKVIKPNPSYTTCR